MLTPRWFLVCAAGLMLAGVSVAQSASRPAVQPLPAVPSVNRPSPSTSPPRAAATARAPAKPSEPKPPWLVAAEAHVADVQAEYDRDADTLRGIFAEQGEPPPGWLSVSRFGSPFGDDLISIGNSYNGYMRRLLPAGNRPAVEYAVQELDANLANWRVQRDAFFATQRERYVRNAEKDRAAKALEAIGEQISRADDDGRARLQPALDDARKIADARGDAAEVIRRRSDRMLSCFGPGLYFFFVLHPPDLVARIEGPRIDYITGLARLERLFQQLDAVELELLERAAQPGGELSRDLADALEQVGSAIDSWRVAQFETLDFDPKELDQIETSVAQALQLGETLRPRVEQTIRDDVRIRALGPLLTAKYAEMNRLADEANAVTRAGDIPGGQVLLKASNVAGDDYSHLQGEQSQLQGFASETRTAIDHAFATVHIPPPAQDRLAAFLAVPSQEYEGVRTNKGLEAGGATPPRLGLGLPFELVPYWVSLTAKQPPSYHISMEAGAGTVSLDLAQTNQPGVRERQRIVLVSAEEAREFAGAPLAPPPPEKVELPPRTVDRDAKPSPIAGRWTVSYFDGALATTVTGTAIVAPDGTTAEISLIHPVTQVAYPMVCDQIRTEADGTYVLELRGRSPGLDPRASSQPGPSSDAHNPIWEVPRYGGGPYLATPPLPFALTRVPVAPGATALHISVDSQQFVVPLPPVEPVPKSSLTLRLKLVDPKIGFNYFADAWQTIQRGDESLQGYWEQAVDPTTRHPVEGPGRYRLLERDPENPNRTRQLGVELWWRPLDKPKLQLLALTAMGPLKVQRFFLGMPTQVEAVYEEPQAEEEKELKLEFAGRTEKVKLLRDKNDWARFLSEVILPGDLPPPPPAVPAPAAPAPTGEDEEKPGIPP